MRRHACSYGSGEWVLGSPKFGSSLWLCTIDAPDSTQARAVVTISSTDRGTLGFVVFVVKPLIAASMTTGDDTGRDDMARDSSEATHTGMPASWRTLIASSAPGLRPD